MSKMDGLRAMREAKYEAARKARPPGAPAKAARDDAPVAPPAKARTARAAPAPDETEPATEQLCGHRAISGRTCTREHGHAAKNHRYS